MGGRRAPGLAGAGSAIRAEDLRSHDWAWTEPIATTYRGVRVTTHPPNSSGIVALELLNILETFDAPPPSAFGTDGLRDPGWIHLAIEAAKLAMADRDATLTDPEARDVPGATLLDKERAAQLAAGIDRNRSSRPRAATNPTGGGTIYLAVVDAEGNAVSLIESNYMG